jgi:hypothetical protein
MTDEELQLCYDNWQRYKWKCEDFHEEVVKFFENYKPRNASTT